MLNIKRSGLLVLLGAMCLIPSGVFAEEAIKPVVINTIWVLMAGILVFLMQAGFALLETGMVRSKNAVNVMMKNYIDLIDQTIEFGTHAEIQANRLGMANVKIAIGLGREAGANLLVFTRSQIFADDLANEVGFFNGGVGQGGDGMVHGARDE